MHTVFTYGTLRPPVANPLQVVGSMYNLGWYPGVRLDGHNSRTFIVEPIEVDDDDLLRLDYYEGYDEDHPETSLYLRKEVLTVDGTKGWIYEYNTPDLDPVRLIQSGDWFEWTGKPYGSNFRYLGKD